MGKSNAGRAGLFLTLSLILVGCMGQVNVTVDFYRGGNWEAVTEFAVPREAITVTGGEAQIEAELDNLVREASEEDVRASWEKDSGEGKLVYVVHMKGNTLESLSRMVFEGADITVEQREGERLIHFRHNPDSLDFDSQTIVLRGAEIIAGNGQLIDSQSMMWQNPYREIHATLREQSRFSMGKAFSIGTGIVVVAGLLAAAAYLWRRSQTVGTTYCPWCGAPNPGEAHFCTQCGRSLDG